MLLETNVKKTPKLTFLVVMAVLFITAVWVLYTYRSTGELPLANYISILKSKVATQDDDADNIFAPPEEQTEIVIRPPVIDAEVEEDVAEKTDPSPTLSSATTSSASTATSATDEPAIGESKDDRTETNKLMPEKELVPATDATVTKTKPSPARLSDQSTTPPKPSALEKKSFEKRKAEATQTVAPTRPAHKPKETSIATALSTTPRNGNTETEARASSLLESKLKHDEADASLDEPEHSTDPELELEMAQQNFAPSAIAVTPFEKPAKKFARKSSGLVVIVNKSNSKVLSKSEISNIYRDRITRWPTGERILVLNLPLDSAERHRFSTAVLNMSPLDAATEYSNSVITNRLQNDHRTQNARVVVSYVERNENAIGYVPAEALSDSDNVRVAYSIP